MLWMAYKLMGSSLHGRNGLDATATTKLIEIFVVPPPTHGLYEVVLKHGAITELAQYHNTL